MDKSVVKSQLVEMIKQVYHKTILMEQDASLTQPTVDALLTDIEKLYKQAVLLSYWSPVEVKDTPVPEPVTTATASIPPDIKPVQEELPAAQSTTLYTPVETPVVPDKPAAKAEPPPPTPAATVMSNGPTLKPGKKPISDIAAALSLNERFQLSNQLFKGNMEVLNTELRKLNTQTNYQDAQELLFQLREQYQWKSENPTFLLLEELVMRRYA